VFGGAPWTEWAEDIRLRYGYAMDYHRQTNYYWWIERLRYCFRLYDVLRIDHFRGFDEYYSIPYGQGDATNGKWEKGPGIELFHRMKEVLEFAFDSRDTGSANDYLPHNYTENCVAYTGTHDNETLQTWFQCITKDEQELARNYLCDKHTPNDEMYWSFICAAMRSRANMCIIPLQDYLGKDNS